MNWIGHFASFSYLAELRADTLLLTTAQEEVLLAVFYRLKRRGRQAESLYFTALQIWLKSIENVLCSIIRSDLEIIYRGSSTIL